MRRHRVTPLAVFLTAEAACLLAAAAASPRVQRWLLAAALVLWFEAVVINLTTAALHATSHQRAPRPCDAARHTRSEWS